MLPPDHRFLALSDINADPRPTPANDLETRFAHWFHDSAATRDESLAYAYDIYTSEYKSEVLEAFLLTRATPKDVEDILKVPQEVTAIYQTLFFDVNVFKDELDIEAYAQTYDDNEFGKTLKVCAITLGLDYLRYRFGRGKKVEINVMDALQSMMETGYILSKATKLNPLDSNAAKEARQWMTSTLKAMDTFVKVKPVSEETSDDFQLALVAIDRTTNEQKRPDVPKLEIVH